MNLLDQKLYNLNPDFLTYTLSKVGLQGLTKLLAQAFAPRLRVAGIAPGLTLRSGSQTDARFAEQHADNPLRVGVTTRRPGAGAALHPADAILHRRHADRRQRRAPDAAGRATSPSIARERRDMERRIFIRDFRLQVSIGIHDFEKEGPQTVVVNVDLLLAPADKAHNDRIANVLNYDTVHDGITRLAGSRHFNLQEALVDAILDLCLAQPGVIEARVSTEKPDVYKDCRVGYEAVRRR